MFSELKLANWNLLVTSSLSPTLQHIQHKGKFETWKSPVFYMLLTTASSGMVKV